MIGWVDPGRGEYQLVWPNPDRFEGCGRPDCDAIIATIDVDGKGYSSVEPCQACLNDDTADAMAQVSLGGSQ